MTVSSHGSQVSKSDEACSKISVLKHTMNVLASLQTSLHSTISNLEKEEITSLAGDTSPPHSSSYRSIQSLPDNALVQAFASIVQSDVSDISNLRRTDLSLIAKVSKRFCSLVYGSPVLWSNVFISMSPSMLIRHLRLSKDAGLNVIINHSAHTGAGELDAILKAKFLRLKPHMHRCKSLRFLLGPNKQWWMAFTQTLGVVSFPSITSIEGMGIWDPEDEENWLPSLTSVNISNGNLPKQIMARLTQLTIGPKMDYNEGLFPLLESLRSANVLQELNIQVWSSECHNERWYDKEPTIVELRQLRQLKIEAFHNTSNIWFDADQDGEEQEQIIEARVVKTTMECLTRAFRTPSLTSLTMAYRSDYTFDGKWQIEDLAEFKENIDVLEKVKDATLIFAVDMEEHYSSNIGDVFAGNFLKRVPNVKVVHLELPYYRRLPDYIRICPSIKSLFMRRHYVLRASELADCIQYLRERYDEKEGRFNLVTSLSSSNSSLRTVLDLQVGNTYLRWDQIA